MNSYYFFYITTLAIGIIASNLFGFLLLKNKNILGFQYGLLLAVGSIIWTISEAHIILSHGFQLKLIFNKIEYIGIIIIPISYLFIILKNSDYKNWITFKRSILILIIPVLTILFIFTNQYHHLFWSSVILGESNAGTFLLHEYGIWFWIWSAYLYIILIITYFILIKTLIKKFNMFSLQVSLVILVLLIPWFTNLLHIIKIKPFDIFDVTPVALAVSLTIIIFGFTRLKIFDIVPVARETIVDSMRDNIIVLDNKNNILYLNPSARDSFKYKSAKFIGEPIDTLLPKYHDYFNNKCFDSDLNEDITVFRNNQKKDYNMTVSNFTYGLKKITGKVIVLRDITQHKKTNELLNYRVKFENLISTLSTKFIKFSSAEIDDGINCALKTVAEFAGVDRSYIYILYRQGSKAIRTHQWCNKDVKSKAEKLKELPSDNTLWWLKKLNKFEPVYIPNVSKVKLKLEAEREIIKPQGVKSIVIIPMIYGKVIKGFLGFESIKSRKLWTVNDITLLKLLGEILINVLERKKTEEEIKKLSLKDKLTGLYNRAYFEEELKRLNTKRQLPLSFIMGDVNGLKLINDAFGPREGDNLLKKIARILKNCCRKEDIIARWGGDEFSILLPKTTDKDSEEILNRLRDAFHRTKSHKIPVSISLGTSTKKNYDYNIRTVIKEAEDWMYRRKLLERKSISSSIISSLERTLQEKSYETEEHAVRMRKMALELGNALKLKENKLNELSLLSTLHDIGKVAIPDEILMKKGRLTKKEWDIVKRHPEVGYNISSSSPQLMPIAYAVLSHHEWWDGTGYPRGLKGEEIPLTSRIITIVDAYDVMTHDRSYKKAVKKREAIRELIRCSGTQFDPNLVEIFINVIK